MSAEGAPQGDRTPFPIVCVAYAQSGDEHSGGGQYAGTMFKSTRPSDAKAAFFKSQPDKPEDAFYCGCFGWD